MNVKPLVMEMSVEFMIAMLKNSATDICDLELSNTAIAHAKAFCTALDEQNKELH